MSQRITSENPETNPPEEIEADYQEEFENLAEHVL